MGKLDIINLYEKSDKRYTEFIDNLSSELRVKTDIKQTIKDVEWIDKISVVIPYLENILRNPNRFIINEEEIVKIELARKITVESIKHLSKNTNLIQDFDEETQDVRPSKILNINKEESYDTYENKFIYSLIQNMKFFIDRKKKTLFICENEESRNNKKIDYKGYSKLGNENININVSLDAKLENANQENSEELIKKIEELEKKIQDLSSLEVYKIIDKKHITLVTSPIKKTNVILKNVNFQYAVKLWDYIQSNFDDKTKHIDEQEDYQEESMLRNLSNDSFFIQYLILNLLNEKSGIEESDIEEKKEINDILINKALERMIEDNNDITLRELKSQVATQFEIIRYKNRVAIKEIENIFKLEIEKYLKKAMK